jgi:uncharacterized membrane protein SpoIIM required for sporulation
VAERKLRWQRLEQRLAQPLVHADHWLELGQLYRGLCSDLAMAHAYHLPEPAIAYLHQLAGRTAATLYQGRSLRRLRMLHWLVELPWATRADRTIPLAFALFWLPFLFCGALAYFRPEFAQELLGEETIAQMESMYELGPGRGSLLADAEMASFYIRHNVSIALQCFALGILLGLGSIYALVFNGMFIGAVFGYLLAGPSAAHFGEFVLAHGPLELTGICLAGACGMRLGFAPIITEGRGRMENLRHQALATLPLVALASLLIFSAAFVEGFVSASSLPVALKALFMLLSAAALLAYFQMPRLLGRNPWT